MRPAQPREGEASETSPRRITRRGLLLGGVGISALAGAALAGYAGVEAAGALSITRYRLTPPHWPKGQRLSITAIADIHAGGPNMGLARIREIVGTANTLRSDLIALLGDFVATHRFVTEVVPGPVWADELAKLSAPLGTYAILGNHDWWHHQQEIRDALKAARIPLLENQAMRLGEPGQRFWLAGLGDQLAFPQKGGGFLGADDLPGTLAQVSTPDPVILLAHEPDIFVRVSDRVSLTLAGHTHGGQIRLPLVWPSFVPSSYGARFAYGHIREGGREMIVSGGLGTSIVPLRLGVPPEILRIDLGG